MIRYFTTSEEDGRPLRMDQLSEAGLHRLMDGSKWHNESDVLGVITVQLNDENLMPTRIAVMRLTVVRGRITDESFLEAKNVADSDKGPGSPMHARLAYQFKALPNVSEMAVALDVTAAFLQSANIFRVGGTYPLRILDASSTD